jgi:hypothetical protein
MLLDGLFLFMYNLIEMVLIISLISCIYCVNFSNTFIFPAPIIFFSLLLHIFLLLLFQTCDILKKLSNFLFLPPCQDDDAMIHLECTYVFGFISIMGSAF